MPYLFWLYPISYCTVILFYLSTVQWLSVGKRVCHNHKNKQHYRTFRSFSGHLLLFPLEALGYTTAKVPMATKALPIQPMVPGNTPTPSAAVVKSATTGSNSAATEMIKLSNNCMARTYPMAPNILQRMTMVSSKGSLSPPTLWCCNDIVWSLGLGKPSWCWNI